MSHNTHLHKALLRFHAMQKVCDFHHKYGDIAECRKLGVSLESVRDFTERVWEKAHFRKVRVACEGSRSGGAEVRTSFVAIIYTFQVGTHFLPQREGENRANARVGNGPTICKPCFPH